MLGPQSPGTRSRSRRRATDHQAWRSGGAAGRTECELCESQTTTELQYGMRVCPTCDRKYLP